ncbi:MAG: hypothetical protein NC339_07470 [Muribaculaceae bacterium]|nr:hypothetical protein [Muribaculaceae bacterium]
MKRLFIWLVALLSVALTSQARMIRGCESVSEGEPSFSVDSIDCRKDLTRVYGRVIGRPHTSSRIDAVGMLVPGGVLKECTDIDGVDFNRWFQWEDDSEILLELDFGPVKDARSGQLTFSSPRGTTIVKWTTPDTKADKKLKKRR